MSSRISANPSQTPSRSLTAAAMLFAAAAVAIIVALAVPAPAHAAAASGPKLDVPAATIATVGGVELWSKNAEDHRRVASTIKMLNALVVRDHTKLDDVVVITKKAAAVPDGVGLKAGQKIKVSQMLRIMLLPSSNGAAEALAIHVAGSEKKYVAMMNAKARELGLRNTKAADPHGLGADGYSTAADLAVIASALLKDPVLRGIISETRLRVPRPGGGTSLIFSTDRLIGTYRGLIGGKTGYTDPAKYCFVAAARRNGIELVGVVLGADAPLDRFSQMRKLLDWGFAHTKVRTLVSREETMGAVPVHKGVESAVTVHASRTATMPLPTTGPSLTKHVVLIPSVVAPVAAGQQLGILEVSRGRSVIATIPIVADSAVAARKMSLAASVATVVPAWQGIGAAWGQFWGIVARQAAFV